MDKLDIQYKQKQFFKSIYKPLLEESKSTNSISSTLKDNQYIRVLQAKDDYLKSEFFNNIDDLINHTSSKNSKRLNNYFSLSTTNGQGGTKENLVNRSVLGFDFDKKQESPGFNHKDILNRFKKIGLFYHSLIDSGNGYHVYVFIDPTDDILKIEAVQQAIGEMVGADEKALKSTQLLRVPFTYNVKNNDFKTVSIVHLEDSNSIKRKDIDYLYNKYCTYEKSKGSKATKHIKETTNIPPCIDELLEKGSKQGHRYEDLKKIVVNLRNRNKTLNEIKQVAKEWSYKSDYNDNLDYRTENIYNNLKAVKMECKGCKHYDKCYNSIDSDFNYPVDEDILNISETRARTLKDSNRKGVKTMDGNDLMIYGVLLNHTEGLYRQEIIKEITYKDKVRLSDKTLTAALKSLENNSFIDVTGKPKFYKVKPIRAKIELTYKISYAATYEAIKENISTEELRLYNYMRYLHNKQQRENNKSLKGNLFQINQVELAKELGVTQVRISQMIQQLLQEKLLSIWYRQPSKNNGFEYNVYRLNY